LKNCAQKAKKSQQLKETELEHAAVGKAKGVLLITSPAAFW
jgi:hypothetical protein